MLIKGDIKMPIKNKASVWYEQGIIQEPLHPEMEKGWHEIKRVYSYKKKDLFVLSVREGDHLMYSFHYEGRAIDFKKNGITKKQLEYALGNDFQVIEYTWGFHVEYDPK